MRASLPQVQATRGSAFVAINEWLSYFNVRMKQVEVRAGTEVIMKVEPVHHVVSEEFKILVQEERGCLLQDEQVLIPSHKLDTNDTLHTFHSIFSQTKRACSNFTSRLNAYLSAGSGLLQEKQTASPGIIHNQRGWKMIRFVRRGSCPYLRGQWTVPKPWTDVCVCPTVIMSRSKCRQVFGNNEIHYKFTK